jgi:hypothetical protein
MPLTAVPSIAEPVDSPTPLSIAKEKWEIAMESMEAFQVAFQAAEAFVPSTTFKEKIGNLNEAQLLLMKSQPTTFLTDASKDNADNDQTTDNPIEPTSDEPPALEPAPSRVEIL